jgi:cytochrome c-type biogenesis protein CcmH
VLWAVLAAATTAAPGASGDETAAAMDKRLADFSRQLRCLVCQNETLADSQADLAVDLRREIRDQMTAARSDDQIMRFLTDRYGDFVRYRPAFTPKTYPLWLGPFILLAGVLVALLRGLTRSPFPDERPPLSSAERTRARRLLEGRGRA